jgi:membrane protein involved in colicin uptake
MKNIILPVVTIISMIVSANACFAAGGKQNMGGSQTRSEAEVHVRDRIEQQKGSTSGMTEQKRMQEERKVEERKRMDKNQQSESMEKQRAKKMEQEKKELGKGSVQGQKSRDENRKWWQFWK